MVVCRVVVVEEEVGFVRATVYDLVKVSAQQLSFVPITAVCFLFYKSQPFY